MHGEVRLSCSYQATVFNCLLLFATFSMQIVFLQVNIIPRNNKFFLKSKEEFAAIGQKIHARRNKIDYETFDEFKADAKDIAIVETVCL